MATTELPLVTRSAASAIAPSRDAGWYRAAKRARQLSWASLVWMSIEGVVGLIAGVQASSLSSIVWAASSFVEGLASMTIIWRFTGTRLHSATSERTARRWVAGSFLMLVPRVGTSEPAVLAGLALATALVVADPAVPPCGWWLTVADCC